jgi:hypothetical protein
MKKNVINNAYELETKGKMPRLVIEDSIAEKLMKYYFATRVFLKISIKASET